MFLNFLPNNQKPQGIAVGNGDIPLLPIFFLHVCVRNMIKFSYQDYSIFSDIGFGIGPFSLGMLVPLIGYRGLYLKQKGENLNE